MKNAAKKLYIIYYILYIVWKVKKILCKNFIAHCRCRPPHSQSPKWLALSHPTHHHLHQRQDHLSFPLTYKQKETSNTYIAKCMVNLQAKERDKLYIAICMFKLYIEFSCLH